MLSIYRICLTSHIHKNTESCFYITSLTYNFTSPNAGCQGAPEKERKKANSLPLTIENTKVLLQTFSPQLLLGDPLPGPIPIFFSISKNK